MGFEFWTLAFHSLMFASVVGIAAWGLNIWDTHARHRG
jgi:hypothetical protein